MLTFRFAAALALLLLAASPALADPVIDPRIVIAGDEASVKIYSTSFSFVSSSNGGGYYGGGGGELMDGLPIFGQGLYNASGVDWLSLVITVPVPWAHGIPLDYDKYPCAYDIEGGTFYDGLRVKQVDGTLVMTFFDPVVLSSNFNFVGGAPQAGIYAGAHFSIDLRNLCCGGLPCSNGSGGWLDKDGQPLTFNAVANVPEPGSLVLTLIGLGSALAVGLARRRS